MLIDDAFFSKAPADPSAVIAQSASTLAVPPRRLSSSSSSSSDDGFEELQNARDQYYKSRALRPAKPSFVETKLREIILPDSIRTDNPTIDFIIICLSEWFTAKTRDYLRNKPSAAATSIDPERYEQIVKKAEIDELMHSSGPRAEKKLPTVEQLRQTGIDGQYELKVKDFLFGKEKASDQVRYLMNCYL